MSEFVEQVQAAAVTDAHGAGVLVDAFFALTIGGVLAGTGLWRWVRGHRLRSRGALRCQIVNATCLPIGELAAGSVGVRGRVRAPRHTVRAPVSGDEVVGYRLRVAQKQYNRYGERRWKLVLDVAQVADRFNVADTSGEVAINTTAGCMVFLKPGLSCRATRFEDVPPLLQAFLRERGRQLQDDYFGLYEVEWYEAAIRESQVVHVFGRADYLPDPGGRPTTYRQAPTRIVLSRARAYQLVVTDRDKLTLVRTLARADHVRGLP